MKQVVTVMVLIGVLLVVFALSVQAASKLSAEEMALVKGGLWARCNLNLPGCGTACWPCDGGEEHVCESKNEQDHSYSVCRSSSIPWSCTEPKTVMCSRLVYYSSEGCSDPSNYGACQWTQGCYGSTECLTFPW